MELSKSRIKMTNTGELYLFLNYSSDEPNDFYSYTTIITLKK